MTGSPGGGPPPTARLRWTSHVFDSRLRETDSYSSDGTHTHTDWSDCCGVEATVDAAGVRTEYDHDALGRVHVQRRIGAGGQPTVTTTFDYDKVGSQAGCRLETTTTTADGGSSSLVTSREIDGLGRVRSETDAAGLVTTYDYRPDANGPRRVTVTRPDGGTEEAVYYVDGRTKSVAGSGVIGRTYDYGVDVNQDGTTTGQYTSVTTGGITTKTAYDFVGRVAREERAAYSSGTLMTRYHYNQLGRLERVETPGQGDTWYRYDDLGNVLFSGLDVDGDGSVNETNSASTDRITMTDTSYKLHDGQWWAETTTSVFVDGSSTPVIIGTQRQRLTGYSCSEAETVVRETETEDAYGNITNSTTSIDRAAKTTIERVDNPDTNAGSIVASVTINGLLQSTTDKAGVTHTFAYDDLGRRTEVRREAGGTPARTIVEITHYNNSGQVDYTDNEHGDRTNYEYYPYDPNGQLGAGRLKSATNADSKTTYYDYDYRGQVVHAWGDVPQGATDRRARLRVEIR